MFYKPHYHPKFELDFIGTEIHRALGIVNFARNRSTWDKMCGYFLWNGS